MKLKLVWVGKTRNAAIKALIEHYLERVRKFTSAEVIEIRDRTDSGSDRLRIIEKEGEDIIARVESDPFVIVLDEGGREFSSMELAESIEKHRLSATRQITFVIGSHNGLSLKVKQRADLVLALSRMTLTHEFARILLIEQVYRAFAIIHDLPYQK